MNKNPFRCRNHCVLGILLLLLPALPIPVKAQFTWTTNNGGISITKITATSSSLTIPDTITGLPVVSIQFFAALNNGNLRSVTIVNGLTTIGDLAFASCVNLTNVTIPDSVTNLGSGVFSQCSSLSTITIPRNVTRIASPPGNGCANLTAITVDPLNSAYSSTGGVLFNKSQTTIVECPAAAIGSYSIPNTVTNIGYYAFAYCGGLTNIIIPDSVTDISTAAFFNCTGLAAVILPNSVGRIQSYAFEHCNGPNEIIIPASVTNLGAGAFFSCLGLTNVTIPASLTNLGTQVFAGCESLVAINVHPSNQVYSSLGGVLFDKNQTVLLQYPGGKTGPYEIPETATSLDANGGPFALCVGITDILIPKTVTSLGSYTFYGCPNLNAVYFKGDAPSYGTVPFVYFSQATVYYLPGAAGWGSTFAERPTALWRPQLQTDDASFGVRTNQFGFNIIWTKDTTIVVEACTNLASAGWMPVATNTLTANSLYFSDPSWTNYATRFYRLRSP